MAINPVWFCGGEYPKPRKAIEGYVATSDDYEFRMVRPSGNSLPYLARSPEAASRLFQLCKHHSHLYKLDTGTGEAELVQSGEPSGVRKPASYRLDSYFIQEVARVIQNDVFHGEW